MKQLTDKSHFEQLWNSPAKFRVFKNSTTCSTSSYAYGILNQTIEETDLADVYILDVHKQAELKMYIADFLGIEHKSPQLICIQDKSILGHTSHASINKKRILAQ